MRRPAIALHPARGAESEGSAQDALDSDNRSPQRSDCVKLQFEMPASFFDPSTLLIVEPFEDEEFEQATVLGTSTRSGVEGTLKKRDRLWVPASYEESAATTLRTREHEWTHYRQHISTTFGYFNHRLHGVREYLYRVFLKEQGGGGTILERADIIPRVQIHVPQGHTDLANGALNGWLNADTFLGCLWQKTIRNHELENVVGTIAPLLSSVAVYAPGLEVAGVWCLPQAVLEMGSRVRMDESPLKPWSRVSLNTANITILRSTSDKVT